LQRSGKKGIFLSISFNFAISVGSLNSIDSTGSEGSFDLPFETAVFGAKYIEGRKVFISWLEDPAGGKNAFFLCMFASFVPLCCEERVGDKRASFSAEHFS